MDNETMLHAITDCTRAYDSWTNSRYSNLVKNTRVNNFVDWMLFAKTVLKRNDFELLCMVAWKILMDRNSLYHGKSVKPILQTLKRIDSYLVEYQTAQRILNSPTEYGSNALSSKWTISRRKFWIGPVKDSLLHNTDAIVNGPDGTISVGPVIRDHKGKVMGSLANCITGKFSPLVAKLLAIVEGLEFTLQLGLQVQKVETDSILIVQAIIQAPSFSPLLNIILDCQTLLDSIGSCTIMHITRDANQVAHELVSLVINTKSEYIGCKDVPLAITKFVDLD